MISTDHFHYNKTDKTFVADISDLNGRLRMIRAYPDACDAGFDMVSAKTGAVVRFVETAEVRNDGDISYWEFKSIGPKNRGLKVIIFND